MGREPLLTAAGKLAETAGFVLAAVFSVSGALLPGGAAVPGIGNTDVAVMVTASKIPVIAFLSFLIFFSFF
jgi:hypothetical protein